MIQEDRSARGTFTGLVGTTAEGDGSPISAYMRPCSSSRPAYSRLALNPTNIDAAYKSGNTILNSLNSLRLAFSKLTTKARTPKMEGTTNVHKSRHL